MVNPQTGSILHRFCQQLRATDGKSGIDLVLSVAWDAHIGIAGNRQQRGFTAVGDVQQHDRVGAASANIAARAEGINLILRQALAGIRADQQPVGARSVGSFGVRQGIDTIQLGIRPQGAHHNQRQHRDEHEAETPTPRTEPATWSALLWRPRGLLGWNLWWLARVLHRWLVVHLTNLAGNLLWCALLRRNVLRRTVQLPGGFHRRRGRTVAARACRALGSALVSGGWRRATPHRTAKAVKDRVAVAV